MIKEKNLDCLFLVANSASKTYQSLSKTYSAIEPPTWALLLAQSTRSVGFKIDILDANAENLSESEILEKIKDNRPKLICLVVYGQNVNAGTTNMSGAINLSEYIKSNIDITISIVGSHVQALPIDTLKKEKSIDFVFTNEGVYALQELLKTDLNNLSQLKNVKGICFRDTGRIKMNHPEVIVPQDRMDLDMPGYAWDLLPFKERPLDLYRSPLWHAGYNHSDRSPYAALYTSLGCRFQCNFCMINLINRDDDLEVGVASNYNKMRYWSPEWVIRQFDKLVSWEVKTIRISDEMFLLNPKYYKTICNLLVSRGYGEKLNLWSYSRVDTVAKDENLRLLNEAGFKWLCLGIESANKTVRLEASKGNFENVNIKDVVERVHSGQIEVMANYLFGLPEDNMKTMQETLDLSIDLNTSAWNGYPVIPLPGSQIYRDLHYSGHDLPKSYEDYSFHSYNTMPIPTKFLKPSEVLKFRDRAFVEYHSNKKFLKRIEKNFGTDAVQNINEMLEVKLKRKILGD